MKIDEQNYTELVTLLKNEIKENLENYLPGDGDIFETFWKTEIELMDKIEPNWYENFKKQVQKRLDHDGLKW